MMINSYLLNLTNNLLNILQKKVCKIVEKSWILSHIDYFILGSIIITLILSTFASTSIIGNVAVSCIFLTILKVFLIKGQKLELTLYDFFLILYFVFCIISTFNSTLVNESIYGLSKTFVFVVFYFSIVQYLRYNTSKINFILCTIVALISIETIIGLIQNNVGILAGATWQDTTHINPEDILNRIYGTLKPLNPNLYAGYLTVGLPVIITLAFLNLKKLNYLYSCILFVLALATVAAIFFSGCRGAYLGLGAICLGVIFLSYLIITKNYKTNQKIKNIWIYCTSSLLLLFTFVLISMPNILHRIMSIFSFRSDSSTSFRMNVYNSSFQILQDNWILGIGVGNKVFREIYGLYMLSGFDALSTYCVFLEIAVESGVFALISFISFLSILLFKVLKLVLSFNSTSNKIIVGFLSLTIVSAMVHGLVDTVFFRPQIQLLFLTIVAIISVKLTYKKKI